MAPLLNSIKNIEKQYNTGELPVLVTCSDMNSYICKYMRSSASAYKLVSEFVGANMIARWNIRSPKLAFVRIAPEHWVNIFTSHTSAVSLGYIMLDGVIDVNNATLHSVEQLPSTLTQLLRIALFDFWIANEDRTYNNANLLYDIKEKSLVSIDYGGVFNTSSYDIELAQLTTTDTILYADIFRHLIKKEQKEDIIKNAESLRKYYERALHRCLKGRDEIINNIPSSWNVKSEIVSNKIDQLFAKEWTEGVWNNFMDCLKDNLYE